MKNKAVTIYWTFVWTRSRYWSDYIPDGQNGGLILQIMNRFRSSHFITAILLLTTSPAWAQNSTAQPNATAPLSSYSNDAQQLAFLLSGESHADANMQKLLDGYATQLVNSDPDLIAINDQYPGLDIAFKDAVGPLMKEFSRNTMPLYKAELAAFFTQKFTPSELAELHKFYGSDLGLKMINGTSQNLDFKVTTNEMVAITGKDQSEISNKSLDNDKMRAGLKSFNALSPAEKEAANQFAATPTGQKFLKHLPEKNQIDVKWFNAAPSPDVLKKMENAVVSALDAHVAKFEAKAAKTDK